MARQVLVSRQSYAARRRGATNRYVVVNHTPKAAPHPWRDRLKASREGGK